MDEIVAENGTRAYGDRKIPATVVGTSGACDIGGQSVEGARGDVTDGLGNRRAEKISAFVRDRYPRAVVYVRPERLVA